MEMPVSFLESLARALNEPAPLPALHDLAGRELANGRQRETLVEWFEGARKRFPEKEDLLLETLDFVVGWCSPHMKLGGAP